MPGLCSHHLGIRSGEWMQWKEEPRSSALRLNGETLDETHYPAKILTIRTPYVTLCVVTRGGFSETSVQTLPKFQVVTMLGS